MPRYPTNLPELYPNRCQRFECRQRYYVICCGNDLFGELVISRYWGDKNSRLGGQRHEGMRTPELARQRFEYLTRQRLQRGYLPVTR